MADTKQNIENKNLTDKAARRILQGEVVSNKMTRTLVVAIKSRKMHSLYKKYIGTTKKVMVDDAKSIAGIGDFVKIAETRPLSRKKRWELVEVLKKAQ